MAQEVEVKVKVDTGQAVAGVDNLEKSFGKLDKSVGTSKEKTVDYGKQILYNSQLSQKLSQATGGLSDAFMNSVKAIDLTNFSLKGLKTAIISTGVGLLVIAIGELISYLAEMYSSTKKSENALNGFTSAIERQADAFDELTESGKFALDIQQKYAKANGASKEELKKTNDAYLESERKRIEKELVLLQMEHMAVLKNDALNEEDRKKAIEDVNAQMKKLMDLKVKNVREKQSADADDYAQTKETQKQEADKAQQKRVQDGEKAKQLRLQQQTALKNLEQKYADDIENLGDKTEEDKLATQKARALKELDLIKLSEKEKAEAKKLLLEDFQLKEQALITSHADKLLALNKKLEEDKNSLIAKTDEEKLKSTQDKAAKQLEVDLTTLNATETEKDLARKKLKETFDLQDAELKLQKAEKDKEEKIALLEQDLENDTITFETKREANLERERLLLEDLTLTESQKNEIKKNAKDTAKQIDLDEVESIRAREEAKQILLQAGFDALNSLTSIMFGEGKKAQAISKALTLTQIGIDTASAFSKLMAGSEAAAVATGPAYPFSKPIFYASGVVQILANVAKAKKALSGSSSSGGGGGASAPSIPKAPPIETPKMTPPSINVVGASKTNAIAETIAQQGQQPIKAYVVANDVTTQQGLDRNIVSSASIG